MELLEIKLPFKIKLRVFGGGGGVGWWVSVFNEIVYVRQDNCPNLNALSQHYALQKYISVPH